MSKKTSEQGISFRFRKGASIGEPDAESDDRFLSHCFVDTGDYGTLVDCNNPRRIIVGRTGAGKSALIQHLIQNEENVIEISPDNLSLNYISNSDIITTLEKAGVKLDLFYTLLWKHVFATELLKRKYNLANEEKTKSWFSSFLPPLKKKDQGKERALEYLKDWGDKFWQETEYRVKEVTQKLESDINAQLGGDIVGLKAQASTGQKITEEQRAEIIHKAQRVVNSIQIKALSDVMTLLADEVFNDNQQKYYVVIDKLDENWVENDLRYRLIRALIETVKDYRKISSVKIVVALRLDLLQSVFERTRDAGFQEEKYQSLLLHLNWNPPQLEKLLDERIALLVREQYTNTPIKLRTLFPPTIVRENFIDYLLNRTLWRPRDAIAFVNECIRRAEDKGQVSVQIVRDAEREYSAQRIDSLAYEWFIQYPKLKDYIALLERMPMEFKLSAITKEKIEAFALAHAMDGENDPDPIIRAAYVFINGENSNPHSFVIALVKVLFKVGILGIKPDGFTGQLWVQTSERIPSDGQIKPNSTAYIHPMIWSNMGIIVTGSSLR